MAVFDLSEMLADLQALVEVESPSRDITALTRSAAAVVELIERRLGRTPDVIDGPAGPHVHLRASSPPRVLVLGHHDTVFPLGTLATRPFTVADGRATGPGVFDMKGGLVVAVHALAAVGADAAELLISADEEVGSATSQALIEERALACGSVLVLEPAAEGGGVKTGRKGVGTFTIEVTGRAAHAGLEPERGVNALVEAAHQLLAAAAIADPAAGTTVTPTLASAGTAENVVPAHATVRLDVRVTSLDEARRVERALAALPVADPAAAVAIIGGVHRPPLPESATAQLFALARDVSASLGVAVLDGVSVGGGSDGNFTGALGIPTLDGLGVEGGGAHADHEWVDVASMPSASRARRRPRRTVGCPPGRSGMIDG